MFVAGISIGRQRVSNIKARKIQMTERAYFDEKKRLYADEHLDIVFKQISEGDTAGEEGEAIAILLNPYGRAVQGDGAIPFDGALDNIDHAVRWACQFGSLKISSLPSDNGLSGDKGRWFEAKVEGNELAQFSVRGQTAHQAILLAGIQFLREIAYAVLNPQQNETPH